MSYPGAKGQAGVFHAENGAGDRWRSHNARNGGRSLGRRPMGGKMNFSRFDGQLRNKPKADRLISLAGCPAVALAAAGMILAGCAGPAAVAPKPALMATMPPMPAVASNSGAQQSTNRPTAAQIAAARAAWKPNPLAGHFVLHIPARTNRVALLWMWPDVRPGQWFIYDVIDAGPAFDYDTFGSVTNDIVLFRLVNWPFGQPVGAR